MAMAALRACFRNEKGKICALDRLQGANRGSGHVQDYHRFHFPVSGTLKSITHVRGKLYTVNPIAVNSSFANVFTENKRAVCIIDSPDFGEVAFIAIGATMVCPSGFCA